MSSRWPSDTCPPSNAQLALALSILKLKPHSVPVKDHILSIRQYITSGKRQDAPDAGSLPEKHLDSATFWRDAYETSESEQSRLQDRIYDLEQQVDILRASVSRDANPTASKHGLEESQTQESPKKSASPAKRAKTLLSSSTRTNVEEISLLGARPNPKDSVTAPFMRHFFNLQALLLKRSPSTMPLLSRSVIELCTSIDSSIRGEIDRLNRSKARQLDHTDLRCLLVGVSRCYPIFLRSLRRVTALSESRGNAQIGVLIYHIVGLFKNILSNMSQYTINHVVRSGRDEDETRDDSEESSDVSSIITAFTQLLANMALSFDLSQPYHADLMEGFLYHVLEHTGEVLSLFVFKDLKTDPLLVPEPHSALPIASPVIRKISSPTHLTNKLKSAELEAKPTLWLLRQILAYVEKRGSPGFFSGLTPPEQPAPHFPHLIERGKARLQNTLLRGVFGDETPAFGDALRAPVLPEKATSDVAVDESSLDDTGKSQEWFTRELWALIGWDILMKNVGREEGPTVHHGV